jgi:hypothetical protein
MSMHAFIRSIDRKFCLFMKMVSNRKQRKDQKGGKIEKILYIHFISQLEYCTKIELVFTITLTQSASQVN